MERIKCMEQQSIGILLGSPPYNAPPKFKYRTHMIVLSCNSCNLFSFTFSFLLLLIPYYLNYSEFKGLYNSFISKANLSKKACAQSKLFLSSLVWYRASDCNYLQLSIIVFKIRISENRGFDSPPGDFGFAPLAQSVARTTLINESPGLIIRRDLKIHAYYYVRAAAVRAPRRLISSFLKLNIHFYTISSPHRLRKWKLRRHANGAPEIRHPGVGY